MTPKTGQVAYEKLVLVAIRSDIAEIQPPIPIEITGTLKATGVSAVFDANYGDERVILKQFFLPTKGQTTKHLKNALDVVAQIMRNPRFQVNKCLGIFPEQGVAVLSRVPGDPVISHLTSANPAQRSSLVRDCGDWLINYIGGRSKTHRFSKDFWLEKIDAISVPSLSDHRFYLLEALVKILKRQLIALNGHPITLAVTHGDFRAENIHFDGGSYFGIDIQHARWQPLAYDKAQFLVWLSALSPTQQPFNRGVFERDKMDLISSEPGKSGDESAILDFFVGYFLLRRLIDMRKQRTIYTQIEPMISNYFDSI